MPGFTANDHTERSFCCLTSIAKIIMFTRQTDALLCWFKTQRHVEKNRETQCRYQQHHNINTPRDRVTCCREMHAPDYIWSLNCNIDEHNIFVIKKRCSTLYSPGIVRQLRHETQRHVTCCREMHIRADRVFAAPGLAADCMTKSVRCPLSRCTRFPTLNDVDTGNFS